VNKDVYKSGGVKTAAACCRYGLYRSAGQCRSGVK